MLWIIKELIRKAIVTYDQNKPFSEILWDQSDIKKLRQLFTDICATNRPTVRLSSTDYLARLLTILIESNPKNGSLAQQIFAQLKDDFFIDTLKPLIYNAKDKKLNNIQVECLDLCLKFLQTSVVDAHYFFCFNDTHKKKNVDKFLSNIFSYPSNELLNALKMIGKFNQGVLEFKYLESNLDSKLKVNIIHYFQSNNLSMIGPRFMLLSYSPIDEKKHQSFQYLCQYNLVKEDFFDLIWTTTYVNGSLNFFRYVEEHKLFTTEHGQVIKNSQNYKSFIAILILMPTEIITTNNIETILKLDNQHVLSCMSDLVHADLLNPQNFADLITYREIFNLNEVYSAWRELPPRVLPEVVIPILQICRTAENPQLAATAVIDYIANNYLNNRENNQRNGILPNLLGDTQLTHKDSVHKSVSKSAEKLKNRYRKEIDTKEKLNKYIIEISSYLETLADTDLKEKSAKQGFHKLRNSIKPFKDTLSEIETLEALVLAWLAMHDNSCRIGTLEEAKRQFIEGLYEMERGNNIDEYGVDNLQYPSEEICAPGKFNKILEKLHRIHPDVKIKIITKAGATLKLSCIVKEEVRNHLIAKIVIAYRMSGKNDVLKVIDKIKEDGVESIWPKIENKVAKRMFNEFGSLYYSCSPMISDCIPKEVKPESFLLIKNKTDQIWQFFYVAKDKQLLSIAIKEVVGLEKTLEKLADKPLEKITAKEKLVIEKIIKNNQGSTLPTFQYLNNAVFMKDIVEGALWIDLNERDLSFQKEISQMSGYPTYIINTMLNSSNFFNSKYTMRDDICDDYSLENKLEK